MKILNAYCGIGGNRKNWGNEHEIVGVELNPQIAKIYQDFFPQDKVIVADAHQYLLEHYHEFDFIWSSVPCNTHAKMNLINHISPYKDNSAQLKQGGGITPRYPAMELYQEIIFLRHFFKGKYCVENVIGYYEPLLRPQEVAKHYIWANFRIRPYSIKTRGHHNRIEKAQEKKGFNLSAYTGIDKEKILRNCVESELGLHILNESKRNIQSELFAPQPNKG
jgi:DNA (cytosine-5)-methyltransferase 1